MQQKQHKKNAQNLEKQKISAAKACARQIKSRHNSQQLETARTQAQAAHEAAVAQAQAAHEAAAAIIISQAQAADKAAINVIQTAYAIRAMGTDGRNIKYLPAMLRGNKDVALAAVKKNNGRALEYIDPELIGDLDIYVEIVKAAIESCDKGKPFFHAKISILKKSPDKFKEVVLLAVKKNPDIYVFISYLLQDEIANDLEIATAAITQDATIFSNLP